MVTVVDVFSDTHIMGRALSPSHAVNSAKEAKRRKHVGLSDDYIFEPFVLKNRWGICLKSDDCRQGLTECISGFVGVLNICILSISYIFIPRHLHIADHLLCLCVFVFLILIFKFFLIYFLTRFLFSLFLIVSIFNIRLLLVIISELVSLLMLIMKSK